MCGVVMWELVCKIDKVKIAGIIEMGFCVTGCPLWCIFPLIWVLVESVKKKSVSLAV